MINLPDKNGKYKLSIREWTALRFLIAAKHGINEEYEQLRARLKLTPGAWRDMRLIITLLDKSVKALWTTIPLEKRETLLAELQHTDYGVHVRGPGMKLPKGVKMMDEDAYIRLVNRAMSNDCFFCDKSCREARSCKLLKDIADSLPYTLDSDDNDKCVFSGMDHMPVKGED